MDQNSDLESKYKGNTFLFLKNGIMLLLVSFLFIFIIKLMVSGPAEELPLPTLVLSLLLLPIVFITSVFYFLRAFKSSKGLVFSPDGIYYFGKFLISWEEIESIRLRSQVMEGTEEKISEMTLKMGAGMGVATGSLAGAGAGIIGGTGAVEKMKENLILAITSKNPEEYLKKESLFFRWMMNLNKKIEGDSGEVIFLNVYPFLKANPLLIVKDLEKRKIKTSVELNEVTLLKLGYSK